MGRWIEKGAQLFMQYMLCNTCYAIMQYMLCTHIMGVEERHDAEISPDIRIMAFWTTWGAHIRPMAQAHMAPCTGAYIHVCPHAVQSTTMLDAHSAQLWLSCYWLLLIHPHVVHSTHNRTCCEAVYSVSVHVMDTLEHA